MRTYDVRVPGAEENEVRIRRVIGAGAEMGFALLDAEFYMNVSPDPE